MELFLRTLSIYLFLLVLFRLTGKRTLSELSPFDFILLLIISEAAQNALIGDESSLTGGLAVILTLVMLDLGLSMLKKRWESVERFAEGVPVVLVDHGRVIEKHLARSHITQSDILQAARLAQGLERMDQIKYAVLENSGGISIIPMAPQIEDLLDRHIEAALQRRADASGPRPPG